MISHKVGSLSHHPFYRNVVDMLPSTLSSENAVDMFPERQVERHSFCPLVPR
jgi:hypothetical protein